MYLHPKSAACTKFFFQRETIGKPLACVLCIYLGGWCVELVGIGFPFQLGGLIPFPIGLGW